MAKFYTREETDKEIKIVFTSLAVRMYLTWGILLFMLILAEYAKSKQDLLLGFLLLPLLLFVFFITMIIFNVAYWKPMKELRAALKKGEVKISGSRWSLKNPRTIVIPKQ